MTVFVMATTATAGGDETTFATETLLEGRPDATLGTVDTDAAAEAEIGTIGHTVVYSA